MSLNLRKMLKNFYDAVRGAKRDILSFLPDQSTVRFANIDRLFALSYKSLLLCSSEEIFPFS